MKFLEDHELPDWERDRRKLVTDSIEFYQAEIKRIYEKAAPEIERMIRAGEYDRERNYRAHLFDATELLRREIIYLKDLLPPVMMCRKDEILELTPRSNRS